MQYDVVSPLGKHPEPGARILSLQSNFYVLDTKSHNSIEVPCGREAYKSSVSRKTSINDVELPQCCSTESYRTLAFNTPFNASTDMPPTNAYYFRHNRKRAAEAEMVYTWVASGRNLSSYADTISCIAIQ